MTTEAQQTRTENVEITSDPRRPMTAERVKDILEDSGQDVRAYSGRAMYDRICVSVHTDSSPLDVVLETVERFASCGAEPLEIMDLCQFLRGAKTDSMGRGAVVYWPDLEMSREDEDEDDHDCEGPHCCSPGVAG